MTPLSDDTFRYSPRALIAYLELDRADPEGPARTLAACGARCR